MTPTITFVSPRYGADVVGDREAQQEHLESRGQALADHGEYGHGERDVGGEWDTPTACTLTTSVDQHVDRSRHDHAAGGGDRRECGAARISELADDEFTLDLEAGDEEEDRHQCVVDPVRQ